MYTNTCTHIIVVSGQLQVTSMGDAPLTFSNPDRITVGFSSDLIVQVQCSYQNASSATGNIQWTYAVNGSEVSDGLRAFGTSQEEGVLRVYPASLLSGDGALFQCSDGSTVLNVTFELRKFVTLGLASSRPFMCGLCLHELIKHDNIIIIIYLSPGPQIVSVHQCTCMLSMFMSHLIGKVRREFPRDNMSFLTY